MPAIKILTAMATHRQASEVFSAFVKLAACALSAGAREEEYMEEIKRWERDEQASFTHALGELVEEMEAKPFTDILGGLYVETLGSKAQGRGGEFHTPQAICELMGAMMLPLPPKGPVTVAEPACGAGAMILGLAKHLSPFDLSRLRVHACDINRVACDMCYINTTLWNVPTIVTHGNTLSLLAGGIRSAALDPRRA